MKLFKNPFFIVLAAIIISCSVVWYALFGLTMNQSTNLSPQDGSGLTVMGMDLIQEVNVTGKIKSTQNVDLAFERAGKVSGVYSKVGNHVKAGQKLITLENSDIAPQVQQAQANIKAQQAKLDELRKGARPEDIQVQEMQIRQAQANVGIQQAKLDELKNGTRPEEISLAQTAVTNAQNALTSAKDNGASVQNNADTNLANVYGKVKDVLNDASLKADDAITNKTFDLFNNDRPSDPKLVYFTKDTQSDSAIENQKVKISASLSSFKSQLVNIPNDQTTLTNLLTNAKKQLNTYNDFLSQLQFSVNEAIISVEVPQSKIDAFKVSLTAAQNEIQTELTAITSQEQTIAAQKTLNQTLITTAQVAVTNAENTLKSAQDALTLKQAGTTADEIKLQEAQIASAQAEVDTQKSKLDAIKSGTRSEDILAQEAQVESAQANLENIQTQLAKTVLNAPTDGVITKQDIRLGETVSSNTPVVSMMSEGYEIDANVSEEDISKVKMGEEANVTIDTYGHDTIFKATVTSLDPAETLVNGITTYKVTLYFTQNDERIKSGMTANIKIFTKKLSDVVAVPENSIIIRGSDKIVLVNDGNGTTIERRVKTGITGTNGFVQIISGLEKGEMIVNFNNKK